MNAIGGDGHWISRNARMASARAAYSAGTSKLSGGDTAAVGMAALNSALGSAGSAAYSWMGNTFRDYYSRLDGLRTSEPAS